MVDKQITAVFFDWDFTLAYALEGVSHEERLTAIFQHAGLDYTLEEIEAAWQGYLEDIKQGQLSNPSTPQTQQDITNFYRQILLRLGHENRSQEFVNALYDAYALLPVTLYEDTLPTLQALKQKGLSLGIISNHSTTIRVAMANYLGDLIVSENIIISQEEGVHKPAKTIFQRAVSRLRVAPANSVFVGDNLEVDAIGAVEQGQFGLGIWVDRRGEGEKRPLPPDVTRVTSLYEVLDLVK